MGTMSKFQIRISSFIKLLLLTTAIFSILTHLFSLTLPDAIENDKTIPPAVEQENLQLFYQSFLDRSQPACNRSFLDKKSYVKQHCKVKLYEIGDVATCLDSLSPIDDTDSETVNHSLDRRSSRGAAIEKMPKAVDGKLIHFLFIGDSRIRELFTNFVRLLPDYDLQYDPPISAKVKKLHRAINVTSIVLNLRVSFFWEPIFSNQTKSTFINLVQNHKTDAVKVIVAGMTLHHIMHLQEDSSYYEIFKNTLIEVEPLLRRLATETKVIWLKQYSVIDDPYKASIFYNHMSNLISIKRSIRNFNSVSERILRNSGVSIWDTGDFMVDEYIRSCHIQIRNDLELTGEAYFSCPDLVHPGFVAQFYAVQLFLNEMCNESPFY